MALKDMLTRVHAAATGTLTRHRSKIDQGITKMGDIANTRTGGRYQDQIRRGSDQARAGLDRVSSDRPDPDNEGRAPIAGPR